MRAINVAFDEAMVPGPADRGHGRPAGADRAAPPAPPPGAGARPRPIPAGPRRVQRDEPSFVIEALPAEAFEALLVVASWMGEVIVDDPPYLLEAHLYDPAECWCRLELLPEAGGSTSCSPSPEWRVRRRRSRPCATAGSANLNQLGIARVTPRNRGLRSRTGGCGNRNAPSARSRRAPLVRDGQRGAGGLAQPVAHRPADARRRAAAPRPGCPPSLVGRPRATRRGGGRSASGSGPGSSSSARPPPAPQRRRLGPRPAPGPRSPRLAARGA